MSLYWVVAVIGGGDDGRGYGCFNPKLPMALSFFFSISCSGAFLTPFAWKPKRQALACAMGRQANALKFFVMTLTFSFLQTFRMGMIDLVMREASLSSSTERSPSLGGKSFLGKRMSLECHSLSRCLLA